MLALFLKLMILDYSRIIPELLFVPRSLFLVFGGNTLVVI